MILSFCLCRQNLYFSLCDFDKFEFLYFPETTCWVSAYCALPDILKDDRICNYNNIICVKTWHLLFFLWLFNFQTTMTTVVPLGFNLHARLHWKASWMLQGVSHTCAPCRLLLSSEGGEVQRCQRGRAQSAECMLRETLNLLQLFNYVTVQ